TIDSECPARTGEKRERAGPVIAVASVNFALTRHLIRLDRAPRKLDPLLPAKQHRFSGRLPCRHRLKGELCRPRSMVSDAHDVIAKKRYLALITPTGLESWSIIGTCTGPRSFIFDKTSCSASPWQEVTSRVITGSAAVVQRLPSQ